AAGTEQPLVMLDELPQGFTQRLEQLTVRRERREPLQLILGRAPFRRLMLDVEPGVFIPRPETELALDLLREHTTGPLTEVVDLCAGRGAELGPAAAARTRRSLGRAGPGRGRGLEADLCAEVPELAAAAPVDAVLSNPPYIPPEAVPRDAEVREHDPHRALFGGGPDGLEVPRAVLDWARRLLRPGGVLVMEHADVQGAAAREAAAVNGGFDQLSTLPDLTGRDRFLVARRAPGEAPSGSER